MKTNRFLLFVALFFGPFSAMAWWGDGHRIVADVAYQALSDTNKAAVSELLTHHPTYAIWSADYSREVPNNAIDLKTYVFIRASTWADDIKSNTSAFYRSQYNHPNWHFVDYPLVWPGFAANMTRPAPNDDVLYGIQVCTTNLKTSTNPEERAAYMSLLIHYIGDIHQPLHCSTFFSTSASGGGSTYPNGDSGGNTFYVKTNSSASGIKLHSLWDSVLGTNASFTVPLHNLAMEINNQYRPGDFSQLATDYSVESWCWESRNLAANNCYRFQGNDIVGQTGANSAVVLPDGYLANMVDLARQQAALGGYRLAEEIARCLDQVWSTTDSGDGSLSDAVAHSRPGDVITFANNLDGKTITLGNELHIAQNLSIDAHKLPHGITLQGNHPGMVIWSFGGTTNLLRGLKITGGRAIFHGGGIYNEGNLYVMECAIYNNVATDQGGGIENDGQLTLDSSTVYDNFAAGPGGGIANMASLTINNSTIVSNMTADKVFGGGGVFDRGTLMVNDSTICANFATNGYGGGLFSYSGSVLLTNTIVANNSAHNGTNISGSYDGAGNLVDVDPLLGNLADNGGPTLTMLPEPGSQAIGRGGPTVLTTDQRGQPRPATGSDIGSVQRQSGGSSPQPRPAILPEPTAPRPLPPSGLRVTQ